MLSEENAMLIDQIEEDIQEASASAAQIDLPTELITDEDDVVPTALTTQTKQVDPIRVESYEGFETLEQF